ncbi:glycosyl hydrolase family 47-domain-containing protein [Lipomyces mesembrius]
MVSVLRFRRYRTLILFSCIILLGIYQLNKSNQGNAVPAKFMKPSMPDRPPTAAVGSASKLLSTSNPGITENSPPEKLVKDINEDLGLAEDTAYRVEYPPVDENTVDDETASTQEPEDRVIIQSKPLTVSTYEGTYSPDDHRVDSNSITTPAMPFVENIFKKSRITKYPIPRLIPLPDDPPIGFPKIQGVFASETPEQRKVREERLNAVREAFIHSWNGYKTHAWGHDEIRPVTNGYADPFGGWGASIVDALDSLQIMGLSSELEVAKKFVASIDFTRSNIHNIPVFETVIRYLGGLISAYDLSNGREHVFLSKAVELADLLFGAFDTPNGMPVLFYDPQLAHRDLKLRAGKHMVLAQFASLSLEFTRLAQLTENQTYYSVIQRVMDHAEASLSSSPIPGLWPLRMDISGCSTEEDENGQSVSGQRSSTPPLRIPKDGSSDSIRPSQQLQNKINDAAAEATVDEEATPSGQKLVKRQLNLEENKDGQVRSTTLNEVGPPDSNVVIPPAKPDPKCVNLKGLTESIRDHTTRKFSAGALGDSAYEYLVKQHLLLGGTVGQYKTLYETTSASIKSNLLYRPMVKGDPDILFAGNVVIGPHGEITKDYEMTHLSCFLGGMYALGSRALELQDDIKIGAKLADGCYWAYNATRTGIMPENFHVEHCSSNTCHWVDPRERQTQTDSQLRNRSLKKRQESNVVIPEGFQIIPEKESPIAESHVDSVSSGETVDQEFLPAPESLAQKEAVSAFSDSPQSNDQFTQTEVQAPIGAVPNEEPVSEKQTTAYPASGVTHSGPGMILEHSVGIRTEEVEAKTDAPVQVAIRPPADTSSHENNGAHAIQGESVIVADGQRSATAEQTSEQATEQLSQQTPKELRRSAANIVSRDPQSEPLADLPKKDQMKDAIESTSRRTESTAQTPGTLNAPQTYQAQSETAAQDDLVEVDVPQRGPVDIPDAGYKRSQLDSEAPARAAESRTTNEGMERAAHDRNNGAPEQSAMKSRDQAVAGAEVGTVSPSDYEGAGLKDEADGRRASSSGAQAKPAEGLVEDDTDRWEVGGWYDQPRSFLSQDGRYLLRPEGLESIFILYRVTGDREWQDKGWQMFSAINKYCRTATAFSAIADVTDNMHNRYMDEMESFWMAETLKYAYLLFADPSLISLDDYVFNTEAHPFLRPSPVTNAPE